MCKAPSLSDIFYKCTSTGPNVFSLRDDLKWESRGVRLVGFGLLRTGTGRVLFLILTRSPFYISSLREFVAGDCLASSRRIPPTLGIAKIKVAGEPAASYNHPRPDFYFLPIDRSHKGTYCTRSEDIISCEISPLLLSLQCIESI